ncbi:hypothetical protein NQ314_008886 [Rhamnusium bicolor]|uniref:Uncharacterized protein n=1 Tax=Rhamnusium bicolor TaxID=1586634 RepID=A0AAV8Y512_9CUCU|nr:hypothetical protein NQ314_008886 [Rhamnusium bicolor]
MENARENLNIYEDVCDFDLGDEVEKLKTENENLQKHIRSLEDDIEKITATVVKLTEDQDTLKNNISTLYLTAKAEIERKDRMISELRTKGERKTLLRKILLLKKFKYDNNSKVTQERAQEEFDDKNQHSSAAGRWHSEGKECDVLEDNTAKEFKYDVSKGRKKDFDDNRQSGRAGSSHSEEKEGIVLEDNTDKKLKCNVGGEEGEVFDKHDSYRSGSLQSEERENIWEDNSTNKFKCDNFKERREEFYDKHRNRHRSRSRHPGDKYNNRGYRSRSKSWERNEFYYNDDRGRWYNHNDNFSFSDERAWKFGYRENWNDTRGVWENDVYGKYEHRHFGYRDSRGQHKQYFERAAHVKRESSPVHHTFSEREEKYEKPKEYNKLEVKSRNKEPSQRLTKSNTVQESSSIGTIRETTISEKEDVTKTKPKKRLKMLDEAEKKMRKLRATPIKSNNSWSEQIPSLTNNRLKEISRNITEEVDNGYRKDLKKCKPEIAGREDSKANKRSMKKISRRSTEEVNKKESLKKGDPDKILFIDLYDEDEEDQDLIIIDEFSNSNLDDEKFEKKEAVEKNKILSEDLTNNTIQDITYHLTNEGNNVYHFKQKDINSIDKHATVNLDAANTDKKIKGMSKVDLLNTRKKNRKVEERIKDVNKTKKSETNDGKYLNVNLNVGNSADDDKIFKNFSEENLSKSAKQVISLFGENTKGKNYVDKKRNVFVFEKSLNFGADNSTGNEMRDAKKFNKSPPKEDLSNTPKQSVKLNSCVKGVNKRVTYHQENINRTEDSSIVKMDAENTTKNRKREASKKIEILSNIRLDTEKNANVEMKNINQSVSCEKKEAKKKKNTPKDLSNTTNKEGKLSPKINIKNEKKNMQPKQQMSSIHLDDENTSKNKKITTRRKIKIANDDSTNSTKKDMNIVMEKKDVSLCDKKNVNVILDADYEPPKEENNSSSNTHVSNTTHENMETVEKQIMTDRGNVKKCSKQKIVIDIEDTSNVNRDVANTTDKKMESKEKIKKSIKRSFNACYKARHGPNYRRGHRT